MGRCAGRARARLDDQRQPDQRYHGNLNLRRDGLDARAADLRPARHRFLARLGLRQRLGPAEPCAARASASTDREARSSIRLGFGRYTDRGGAGRRLPPDRRRGARAAGASPRDQGAVPQGRRDARPGSRGHAGPAAARRRLGGRAAARRRLRGRDGLLDLPRDRRQGGFREAAAGQRGGRGSARPRRACDPDLAARLPDHPDRGAGSADRADARAGATNWIAAAESLVSGSGMPIRVSTAFLRRLARWPFRPGRAVALRAPASVEPALRRCCRAAGTGTTRPA